MPVSASTNDRLRDIMSQAQAYRSQCTVADGSLSALHVPSAQKAISTRGLLASIRSAFKNLISALPADAPGTADERKAIFQEVTRLDQPSYYEVMSRLGIDWSESIIPGGPYTYAHKAAMLGMLPDDFGLWDLRDRTGATVAHLAAEKGHLPAGFNRWDITRGDGWTVAHEAALNGHLPANIDPAILDWTDRYGKTVRQAIADHERCQRISSDQGLKFN